MKNGPYYAKVFFGAIVVYILLDHASGTKGISSSLFNGLAKFTNAAQGQNVSKAA